MKKFKQIKDMNVGLATVLAMLFGTLSLYLTAKIIPVFLEVVDLLDKGTGLTLADSAPLLVLMAVGIFTYVIANLFVVFNRRVLDHLYGSE